MQVSNGVIKRRVNIARWRICDWKRHSALYTEKPSHGHVSLQVVELLSPINLPVGWHAMDRPRFLHGRRGHSCW